MSITNNELIGNALRGINVISEVGTPSAEQGKHGLRKLNQMMELLKERDVDVGWFTQSSTTDDSPIPDWAELSLESMLSVLLAPAYGVSVSMELGAITNSTAELLVRKSISEKLENANMSHLPWGQGHYGNKYDISSDEF